MSDNRKEKEILLPQNSLDIANENNGLRVKEEVANKEKETNALSGSSAADALVDDSSSTATPSNPKSSPIKKTTVMRCFDCKKKTGLAGFKCRCGENFCSTHRYPEKHSCNFDFQTLGKEQLSKNNPLIKSSKVSSI